MLQLSDVLLNQPILSLRSGTPVATITAPIIDPNNLHIEGFYCQDSKEKKVLVLLPQDIRDIIPQGLVINDHDVLAEPQDLVRLRDILNLHFELIGKHVFDTAGKKIGKVEDYATDLTSLYIQRIYVTQSILKSFTGGNLGIDRTQIVEITPKKIVVNELLNKMPAHARLTQNA
jgi:sporulation protein YlmC with PRC-barrel domain